ncbi:hypothetical protein SESBI_51123, partial [Sesbania bispinosa]
QRLWSFIVLLISTVGSDRSLHSAAIIDQTEEMAKIALGTTREATQPDCIQALVVEFIATFLFVFAGV